MNHCRTVPKSTCPVPYHCGGDIAPGGTTINGVATSGGAKTAWFKDSEGNIMALAQTIYEDRSTE